MTDNYLLAQHDVVLFDLDGTLYRGAQPLPWAEETLAGIRARGTAVRFVTNNAAAAAHAVAERLNKLALFAEATEVHTSAQAAAQLLAQRLPEKATVLVVGTESLAAELRARGLQPVRRAEKHVQAVVQGHSPETEWSDLAEACLAIRNGALWVACNFDVTLPTERGQLPGNGAMVTALQAATEREPEIAGKPGPALLHAAAESVQASDPLIVGDRLDTDIAGAVAAGYTSLIVLTGVTDAKRLLWAETTERPRYLAADLSFFGEPVENLEIGPRPGWCVEVNGTDVIVSNAGGSDSIELLRALCHPVWSTGTVAIRATCDRSAAALTELGLR